MPRSWWAWDIDFFLSTPESQTETVYHQYSLLKKSNNDPSLLFHFLVQRPHAHNYCCKTLSTNNNPLQQPSIHNQINFHLENSSTQLACLSSNSLLWKKTTCHTNCSEWSNYTSFVFVLLEEIFLFLAFSSCYKNYFLFLSFFSSKEKNYKLKWWPHYEMNTSATV